MNHRIVCRRTLGWLTTIVFCGLTLTSAAAEVVVDGVPLPSDVTIIENAGPSSDLHRRFSGAWVGSWGDTLKHILVVERISDQGEASVIYAVGDLATADRVRSWKRYNATVSGDTLTISSGFTATYKTVGNTLRAGFERGTSRSRAIMSKVEIATLLASREHITWSKRQVEFLNTDLVENGTPVRLEAAVKELLRRPDVSRRAILMGGNSRGGILSVAYAGKHPEQIPGVINFVGGWIGEGCAYSDQINQTLFKWGASYGGRTLWLYGKNDMYYSIGHSRSNFEAYSRAGGNGAFVEFDTGVLDGHDLVANPSLWEPAIGEYLSSIRR